MEPISRLFRSDLGLSDDGRTVSGYAVPFMIPAEVDDGEGPYLEAFSEGAFRRVVRAANRVRFHYLHRDSLESWIGNARLLREDKGRGLWAEFRLDDPRSRPEVEIISYKIRSGQLPALSVSFTPGQTEAVRIDGQTVRLRRTVKQVDHIALVPDGAYPMLEPLAVREAPARKSSADQWRAWRDGLTMPPSGRT